MKFPLTLCTLAFFTTPSLFGYQDDYLEDNDTCATATPVAENVALFGSHSYNGLYVSKTDKDHYAFCVPPGSNVGVFAPFTHATADINLYLLLATSPECGTGSGTDELATGESTTNNESLTWFNTTGAPVELILEVSIPSSSIGDANTYNLVFSGIGNECYRTGTTFCDPANNNCSLRPTFLYGIPIVSGAGLLLMAEDGPFGQFGYFLVSRGMSSTGVMLSRGNFCLGGGTPFGRYNVAFPGSNLNSTGRFNNNGSTFSNLSNTGYPGGAGFIVPTTVPIAGAVSIMAGETWHFQLWHRDAACDMAGSSNFSNGLSVTF